MGEIRRWKGIRNTDATERFAPGDLATGVDVDINNSGKILSREGQTVINSTAAHSLYSNGPLSVLVQGQNMKTVEDESLTQLVALTSSDPVSYETIGDNVFYSNGSDIGIIRGRTPGQWGVNPPTNQPASVATAGSLPPGRYMYALTFLRADGFESGTGLAGLIDLPLGGGIAFSGIKVSTNPTVTGKILYLTTPNGEVMFRGPTLANSQTSAIYNSNTLDLTIRLTTQFMVPPPPGTIVREYHGSICVVVGNLVYFSMSYKPELFRLDTDFLQFPGQITMFECVNDGIYVGTADETVYLSGSRLDQMKNDTLFDYGVIPGSAVKTLASFFETNVEGESRGEQSGLAVVWASEHGVCLGREGGATVNLTETRYSFPNASVAAGLLKQARGFNQYIVVLRGAGEISNAF